MSDNSPKAETTSDLKNKDGRWEILREALVAGVIDVAVLNVFPMLRKLYAKLKPDHDEQVMAAAEHFKKGEYRKGVEVLHRAALGMGMADEQIEDYDFTAVQLAYPKDKKLPGQLRRLERWLASDKQLRDGFRNSITLEPDPIRRLTLIRDYAKLSNAERRRRLTAHGKLDPSAAEEFVTGTAQAALTAMTEANTRIGDMVTRRRTGVFNRMARTFIR